MSVFVCVHVRVCLCVYVSVCVCMHVNVSVCTCEHACEGQRTTWELFLLHLAVSLIVSAAVCTENQPVAGQKPRAIPVSVALLDEGVLALQVCSSHPGFCGSGDHSHLLRHVVWQVLYPRSISKPQISLLC